MEGQDAQRDLNRTAKADRPPSQVEHELEKLNESMEAVASVVSRVEMRFTSILKAPNTTPDTAEGLEADFVPLAGAIRSLRFKADNIQDCLAKIIGRAEL